MEKVCVKRPWLRCSPSLRRSPWSRRSPWLLLVAFAAAPVPASTLEPQHSERSPHSEQYLAYRGTAVDRHTLNFLYEERHWLLYRDGRLTERVVLYTCPDGSAFARKTVGYVDPLAPDFMLQDASNGLEEGIRSRAAVRSVFFRKDAAATEKTASLPQVPELVADAGFDEFIQANWPQLLRGGALPLHFLVPSRLDDVNFEVRHVRTETVTGQPAEVFRLKLAGALGFVVRSIDVTYGSADHVLLRYDGVSDLRDRTGANYTPLINFPPADRSQGDAQRMAAARQAPLASCR